MSFIWPEDAPQNAGKFAWALILDKPTVDAALRESWRLGMNAGGEVATLDVKDGTYVPPEFIGRKLFRKDVDELDRRLAN